MSEGSAVTNIRQSLPVKGETKRISAARGMPGSEPRRSGTERRRVQQDL